MSGAFRSCILATATLCLGILIGRHSSHPLVPSPFRFALTNQTERTTALSMRRPAEVAVPPLLIVEGFFAPGRQMDIAECLLAFRHLNADECKSALDLVRTYRGEERRTLLRALASRWVELDPEGAFDFARRNPMDEALDVLGRAAAQEIARHDPQAALALIDSATGSGKLWLANWIVPAVARSDPLAAVNYLSADHPALKLRGEGFYNDVAREYAAINPHAALDWASSTPAADRSELARAVLERWAQDDPAAAVAALPSERSKSVQAAYRNIAASWSQRDPEAAMAWISGIKDEEMKKLASLGLQLDPVSVSSDQALSIINSITSPDAQARVAAQFAGRFGMTDPEKALAWTDSLPTQEARSGAASNVLLGWSNANPQEAAKYAVSLPDGSAGRALLSQLIERWASQSPADALAFAKSLPAGPERDAALASGIRNSQRGQQAEPALAIESISQIQDEKLRADVLRDSIGSIAGADPAQATKLAADLPAEQQPKAFYNLIRTWGFSDQKASGEWIATLPEGPGRDSAVSAYVSVLDGIDPAAATRWATTISNPTDRLNNAMKGFTRWVDFDPDQAGAWLQNAGLSQDIRPFFEKELNRVRQKH